MAMILRRIDRNKYQLQKSSIKKFVEQGWLQYIDFVDPSKKESTKKASDVQTALTWKGLNPREQLLHWRNTK